MTCRSTRRRKGELLSFVRDEGKGFVAAHVALTAFESWPEFGDLLGARFDGHPVNGPGTVVNEDPAFPATKHFPAAFDFTDEFYQPKDTPATRCHVLLRLDLANVRAEPEPPPARSATTRSPGRRRTARAACSTGRFRHAAATWDIRDVQQMYFEAIKWALGSTDAILKPHPMTTTASAPSR